MSTFCTTTKETFLYDVFPVFLCRLVNNRVYMFGWYVTDGLTYTFKTNKFPSVAQVEVNYTQSDFETIAEYDDADTITIGVDSTSTTGLLKSLTWEGNLIASNHHSVALHDENSRFPDCIWTFGGWNDQYSISSFMYYKSL